ncbi:MAG: AAA family ATPase, partial [Candidatus Nanopelagicales bacterium]
MRLHEVRLVAVGPFADEQVIDFDRLGAGGLFLFQGPTGVGKSTILDAVTFALYGGLASESGDAARMRSDFAAPDQRPEVACEFSVRGTRYRVTRSPEYLRPKKRGGGFTREKSAVHLQRWADGGWVSQSHAKDEVGTLIGELLGLNRAQFRQVVLLPQGEFATFLRADDDARKDVLVKLFGTQFFSQVTGELQARAQAVGRELAVAEGALGARVAAACEAAGMPADVVEEIGELDGERTLERLETLGAELSIGAAAAAEVLRVATDAEQAAREEHALAADQASLVLRREGIRAALANAEQQRPAHDERRARLAEARRALPVRPLLQIAEAASVELAACEAQCTALRAVGPNAGSPCGAAEAPRPDTGKDWAEVSAEMLAQHSQELRKTAAGLAHLVQREQCLAEQEATLVADRVALAGLVSERDKAVDLARALPDQVDRARAALDAARVAVERAHGAADLLANAQRQSAAAARVDVLEADLTVAQETARAAKRAMRTAVDSHDLLIAARMTDLRAEIASQLVSGDPCGVCGSREHPAPASGSLGGISEQQIRQAAADRDEAHHVLDEADRLVFQVGAELASVRSVAGGRSVDEWNKTCAEFDALVAAGEHARGALPALMADLDGLILAERSSRAQGVVLVGEVAACTARIHAAAVQVQAEATQVQRARDGFPTVADRVSHLTQCAAQWATLGDALSRVEHA